MPTPRLPNVGDDDNTWGGILNEYLSVSLDANGAIRSTAISNKVGIASDSPTSVTSIWVGSQEEYDAVVSPDPLILYFII